MPYCTQNDLETLISMTELVELTTEWEDIPNFTIIAEIINRVDTEIDSYISVRYVTPLVSVPDMIKGLSIDMVIYHLYSRRSAVPLSRRTKYDDAINFLQNVALGNLNIIGQDGYENSKKSNMLIEIDSNDRIFLRKFWGNY